MISLVSILISVVMAAPPSKYVTVTPGKKTELFANKTGEVAFTLKVDKGYHIQASKVSMPNLIPTTLTLNTLAGMEFGSPLFPEAKPHKVAGMEEALMAYSGGVTIRVPVKVTAAAGTSGEIAGTLRYQACNEKTCFFPMTVPVTVPFSVK